MVRVKCWNGVKRKKELVRKKFCSVCLYFSPSLTQHVLELHVYKYGIIGFSEIKNQLNACNCFALLGIHYFGISLLH